MSTLFDHSKAIGNCLWDHLKIIRMAKTRIILLSDSFETTPTIDDGVMLIPVAARQQCEITGNEYGRVAVCAPKEDIRSKQRYDCGMSDPSAFDALMLEVSVEKGWCGSVIDGRPFHVTDFLPTSGQVTADQFADWLFAADGVDPDEDRAKWQSHLDGLRDAFVRHMGAETADVGLLR